MKSYTKAAAVLISLSASATSFLVVPVTTKTKLASVSSLNMVSRDEFLQPHFTTAREMDDTPVNMDHMVECAENGSCSVDEMFHMIRELDELNDRCSRGVGMECDIDSNEARTVLKQALESQITLSQAKEELQESTVVSKWRATAAQLSKRHEYNQGTRRIQDNSFDHHVDYRQIAEYESH